MSTFRVHVTSRDTGQDISKPLNIEADSPEKAERVACEEGWLVRKVEAVGQSGPAAGRALMATGTLMVGVCLFWRFGDGPLYPFTDDTAQGAIANAMLDIRAGVAVVASLVVVSIGAILSRR